MNIILLVLYVIGVLFAHQFIRRIARNNSGEEYNWSDAIITLFLSCTSWGIFLCNFLVTVFRSNNGKPPKWM